MDLGYGLRRALAKITGAAIVDEKAVKELVKELQRVLITNDVNVKLVFELSKRIEERALREKPVAGTSAKEHVVRVVYDELVKMMGERHEPKLQKQKILLLGLFGSGKSTSVAKIAKFYKEKGLGVGVICADVSRPAAYEQLEQLSHKISVDFYGAKGEKDAEKIVRDGLARLRDDVIIVDSSGRSAFDPELIEELKKIERELRADEKFLVISADIGQIAGKQAEEFHNALGLTGVIITKMDGSGKGGGALSAVAASNAKVAFIGTGEKMDDVEPFDAPKFVGRLLGFPDLEALLEKVRKVAEEEKITPEALEEKFTFKTFQDQLRAAKKLGPLKNVFQMLGASDLPPELMQQSEEKLRKYDVIINSMTRREREDAGRLRKNKSRIERIARGAGVPPEDVRELLSHFEKVEKMVSSFKKNRGLRRQMEKLMRSGIKFG
ncbi:MAG: signal recognition particle receptor subunit alpha [Candidatus Micrarchaeota archaeon]